MPSAARRSLTLARCSRTTCFSASVTWPRRGGPRTRCPLRRAGGDQQLGHGAGRGQLVEGRGVQDQPLGLLLPGQVQLDLGYLEALAQQGPHLVAVRLDLDRLAVEFRVLADNDPHEVPVVGNELLAQVAE